MTQSSDLERENRALRERLSRLTEANLRINESLEFDTVLQEVLDSARLLSGASYGVITLFNDSGAVATFLASGMTPEEAEGMWAMADGPPFLEHLRSLAVPVRTAHLTGYAHSIGLADFSPLAGAGAFMSAPIRHRRPGSGRHLPREEGTRSRVQPRGRRDACDLRLPGRPRSFH